MLIGSNVANFKRTPYRNKKILAAAKGEPCLVNLPGCTGGGEDTVPAHSNQGDDGKGAAQKSDDIFIAFACQYCHDVLDRRRKPHVDHYVHSNDYRFYHDRGIKRTIRRLLDLGVIK